MVTIDSKAFFMRDSTSPASNCSSVMITTVSGDLSLVTPLSEPFSWDVVEGEPVWVDTADNVDEVVSTLDDKDDATLSPKEPIKQSYHRR